MKSWYWEIQFRKIFISVYYFRKILGCKYLTGFSVHQIFEYTNVLNMFWFWICFWFWKCCGSDYTIFLNMKQFIIAIITVEYNLQCFMMNILNFYIFKFLKILSTNHPDNWRVIKLAINNALYKSFAWSWLKHFLILRNAYNL